MNLFFHTCSVMPLHLFSFPYSCTFQSSSQHNNTLLFLLSEYLWLDDSQTTMVQALPLNSLSYYFSCSHAFHIPLASGIYTSNHIFDFQLTCDNQFHFHNILTIVRNLFQISVFHFHLLNDLTVLNVIADIYGIPIYI